MTLWLAAAVHMAVIEDDLVLLDLATDAYSCLPAAAPRLRFHPVARSLDVADSSLCAHPAIFADLIAARLVTSAPEPPTLATRAWPGPPVRSAFPETTPALRPGDGLAVVRAVRDARVRYPGRGLEALIRQAKPPPVPAPPPTPGLLDQVAAFHRWSPYAPVSGKCLLRAFLLLRCLRRAGHDALWVFGVSTWPFQAHCWLQAGDTVLDDTAERASGYTPILVV
jgi:hypothetical protein